MALTHRVKVTDLFTGKEYQMIITAADAEDMKTFTRTMRQHSFKVETKSLTEITQGEKQ